MSNKKFSLLAFAAAGSVVLAVFVWQYTNRQPSAAPQGGNLIQGLNPSDIAEIMIKKNNQTVDLRRKGNGFVVVDKNNYPASNSQINDLLAACFDIRQVELYTEDEKNFKDLGVTEENAEDVVKFLDSTGKIITGVIIGNMRPEDNMAYGRLVSDRKVYVVYNMPWVKSSPLDYIEKELISVERNDINSVTVVVGPDSYTLAAEADSTEPLLQPVPGAKRQKKGDCASVFSALTNLIFNDCFAQADKADLKFDMKYTCLLKDSTLYTIDIANKESKTFIKCSAEFTDKTQVKKEQAVESQEELEKKDAKLLAREKAKKFSETTNGWVYEIPAYKAKNLARPLAELIEDVTVAKPAEINEPK